MQLGRFALPEACMLRVLSFLPRLPGLLRVAGVSPYFRRLTQVLSIFASICRKILVKRCVFRPFFALNVISSFPIALYSRRVLSFLPRLPGLLRVAGVSPYFRRLTQVWGYMRPSAS